MSPHLDARTDGDAELSYGYLVAAPFVTAAVAARLAEGAKTDSDRIADSLARTAIDLSQPGKDPVFGRGLIQSANPCSASASTQ